MSNSQLSVNEVVTIILSKIWLFSLSCSFIPLVLGVGRKMFREVYLYAHFTCFKLCMNYNLKLKTN